MSNLDMKVAATLDNEIFEYVQDENFTLTGSATYDDGKHHDGFVATSGNELTRTFSASFDAQDGFAVGMHIQTRQGFTDALDEYFNLFYLWDASSLGNGYLYGRLEYRNSQSVDGFRIETSNGTAVEIELPDMSWGDNEDHSIVITGKYETATTAAKIFLYMDGRLIKGVRLTDSDELVVNVKRFNIGATSFHTNPANCNFSDVFLQSRYISSVAAVRRYHEEGLNLDCVNDATVFNPPETPVGPLVPRQTSTFIGMDVMDYDETTSKLWGTSRSDTELLLSSTDETGASTTEEHDFGAGLRIMFVQVVKGDLFVAVRVDATGVTTLYKTDPASPSFGATNVLTFNTHYYPRPGWSMVVCRDGSILVAEYWGLEAGVDPAQLYRSADSGDNWAAIATATLDSASSPGSLGIHYHGLTYDPYRERVWACWGDEGEGVKISDDFGVTFTDLWIDTDTNVADQSWQCIQSVPTPNGVVFCSDTYTNPCIAHFWDAQYDHGWDGASQQRWSSLGPVFQPFDSNIFAIHKASSGVIWMLGFGESQSDREFTIYLLRDDGKQLVLATVPISIGPTLSNFVETPTFMYQGSMRFNKHLDVAGVQSAWEVV